MSGTPYSNDPVPAIVGSLASKCGRRFVLDYRDPGRSWRWRHCDRCAAARSGASWLVTGDNF